MKSLHISKLIAKKIQGSLSAEEEAVLMEWVNSSEENRETFEKAIDRKHQLKKLDEYNSISTKNIWEKIDGKVNRKTISMFGRNTYKYAAILIVGLMIGGAVLYMQDKGNTPTLATIDETVFPGSDKAVLVLSSGTKVELQEGAGEKQIEEEGITIINKDKTLSYSNVSAEEQSRELVYNELVTPYGGGYHLTLSDGTKVWVNSGSTLRFPVEFTDSTREVFLTGEAYFDVTHNGKPFIVSANEINVRVLGTEFNVSAYSDDKAIATTLVEGKVAIRSSKNEKQAVLTPGLQAVLDKDNSNLQVEEVNTGIYTSWVDGKLEFANENLEIVMKRLARWYNFKYSFQNEQAKTYHFSARFSKEEKLSKVLEMLELTTEISFSIEEDEIRIN